LTIEVEPERVETALAQAAKRIAQKYKIPGFRPGKAPRAVVERTVGKQALYEEVIDALGQKVYQEALEQHNIEPFGPGEMEDFTIEPMVFKMLVPLAPIVNLGDYRSVRVPYEEPIVDEHDVDHQLEHIRENQAIVEPIEDLPAATGMVATVNIESTIDGEPFINQQRATVNLYPPLDQDEENLIDFSQYVIGMKPGEDKEFDLAVPDAERYSTFAGKTAKAKIHLSELQKRELPELDDALAQTVGAYETLDALKAEIRSEMLAQKKRQAASEYSDKVIDELVKVATIEFPPQMVNSEVDALVERTAKRMKDQNMTLEEYLKALGKTDEEYREELKPTAEIRLKRGLVLNQIIKDEGLTVSDEQVEQQINLMVEAYGPRADEARKVLSEEKNRHAVMLDLLSSAGVARAVAIAKGEAATTAGPAVETAQPVEPVELPVDSISSQ
jgi:trigger factor